MWKVDNEAQKRTQRTLTVWMSGRVSQVLWPMSTIGSARVIVGGTGPNAVPSSSRQVVITPISRHVLSRCHCTHSSAIIIIIIIIKISSSRSRAYAAPNVNNATPFNVRIEFVYDSLTSHSTHSQCVMSRMNLYMQLTALVVTATLAATMRNT